MKFLYLLLLLFWVASIPLNVRLYLSQQIPGLNFSARLLLALSFILISLINIIDIGSLETEVMIVGVLSFLASIGIFLFEAVKRKKQ